MIEKIKKLGKQVARQILPPSIRRWYRMKQRGDEGNLSIGRVNFGNLRRLTPISNIFGFDRGRPIDRYYIENFLSQYANDIHGRVLEIEDDSYTRQFGGTRVTTRDVLHVTEGNPKATFVGDLTCAEHIPSNIFDCVILTQTLQLIFDMNAALKTLYRILKPGGVLLATLPGISPIDTDWNGVYYWGFTTLSAQKLFTEIFPEENVIVEAYGNVLAAIAFLEGLAVEDIRAEELDYRDPAYQVSITVRAVKP